jgi:hypothetical protein
MAPKQRQKIEIEKTHRDPLLSFNQAVTVDCYDFLGTALIYKDACSLAQGKGLASLIYHEPAIAVRFVCGSGGQGEYFYHTGWRRWSSRQSGKEATFD